MPKLIYQAIASLDGYVEDEEGRFEWGAPDDEVFAFVNDLERPIGTYLYGRRMYETMVFWETGGAADLSALRSRLSRSCRSRALGFAPNSDRERSTACGSCEGRLLLA